MPRPPQAVTARGGPGELRRGGSVCGVAAHGKRRGGVGKEWKERKREEKKKKREKKEKRKGKKGKKKKEEKGKIKTEKIKKKMEKKRERRKEKKMKWGEMEKKGKKEKGKKKKKEGRSCPHSRPAPPAAAPPPDTPSLPRARPPRRGCAVAGPGARLCCCQREPAAVPSVIAADLKSTTRGAIQTTEVAF